MVGWLLKILYVLRSEIRVNVVLLCLHPPHPPTFGRLGLVPRPKSTPSHGILIGGANVRIKGFSRVPPSITARRMTLNGTVVAVTAPAEEEEEAGTVPGSQIVLSTSPARREASGEASLVMVVVVVVEDEVVVVVARVWGVAAFAGPEMEADRNGEAFEGSSTTRMACSVAP